MANYYWDDKIVKQHIRDWKAASTEKQKVAAYRKLHPYFDIMFKNIRNRYFTFSQEDYHYDKTDCMTKCFIGIDAYDESKSAFSFFSVIIKNKLMEKIQIGKVRKNTILYGDSEVADEDNPYLITPEDEVNQRREARTKLIAEIQKFNPSCPEEQFVKDQLIYFFQNFEPRTIAQISSYLYKLDIESRWIYGTTRKIFGRYVFHSKAVENEERLDDKAEKVEPEKYYDDPIKTYNYFHYGKKK